LRYLPNQEFQTLLQLREAQREQASAL